MNLLAHVYLADLTHTSPAGALLGDRVRGQLSGEFPEPIELGIRLHRRIDSYTDQHPATRAAVRGFRSPLRRYAGILCDIYFDHLLATSWSRWSGNELDEFCARAQQQVITEWPHPPFETGRMTYLADLLCSYTNLSGVQHSVDYVASKMRRGKLPDNAFDVLLDHSDSLEHAFDYLFPDLIIYAKQEAHRLREQTGAL